MSILYETFGNAGHKSMTRKIQIDDNSMIVHLFLKMLPVEMGLVAMGGFNSIVDGIFAARFINSSAVAVIGLYYTMMRILEAVGGLMPGKT